MELVRISIWMLLLFGMVARCHGFWGGVVDWFKNDDEGEDGDYYDYDNITTTTEAPGAPSNSTGLDGLTSNSLNDTSSEMTTVAVTQTTASLYPKGCHSPEAAMIVCDSEQSAYQRTKIPGSLLEGTEIFAMWEQNIQNLSTKDFRGDGWSLVTGLEITYGPLHLVEIGALAPLSQLKQLKLFNNKLTVIAARQYVLPNLRMLKLEENEIEFIESGAFKGVPNLTDLDLSENRIQCINRAMFGGLGNLKKLELEENQISKIAPGSFTGLKSLEKLNLMRNKLLTVDAEVFAPRPMAGRFEETEVVLRHNYICDKAVMKFKGWHVLLLSQYCDVKERTEVKELAKVCGVATSNPPPEYKEILADAANKPPQTLEGYDVNRGSSAPTQTGSNDDSSSGFPVLGSSSGLVLLLSCFLSSVSLDL